MLGLGHSLVAGSMLDSLYLMTKSFTFDGTDDIFLTNTLSGVAAADGNAKSRTRSLSVAVWVRLDDDTDNPYNYASGTQTIVSCNFNGGWSLNYGNKKFSAFIPYKDGGGSNYNHTTATTYAKMRTPTGGTDYGRYLYKSDHWHLVVFTSDLENNDSTVVTNLYVDGNRAQAGTAAQDGSSGITQFGSEPETSTSKITSNSPSGGDFERRYDTNYNEIDITIGAAGNFNTSTDVTSFKNNPWFGSIGDVAIWENVVLTQDDIANLYNLHVPIDMSTIQSSSLIGYWRPTNGLDDSVSEVTGTLVDDTAIVDDAPSLDVSAYSGYS